MKKTKNYVKRHVQRNGRRGVELLTSFSLVFSVIAANSACVFIFHQPKLPPELSDLRKF